MKEDVLTMKNRKTKRISAIVSMILVISMMFSGSVWAKGKEKEKRYSDGTVILDKYPTDEELTAKKENLVKLYSQYKNGTVNKSVIDAAMKEFQIPQSDVVGASEIGVKNKSELEEKANQKMQMQLSELSVAARATAG